MDKREVQMRSLYGQHFKKKIYVDNKEATIKILLNDTTRLAINNHLAQIYKDSKLVSKILKVFKPFIKDFPGK